MSLHRLLENSAIFLFPVYLMSDLERVSHVALRTGIISTKFEVDLPIRYNVFTVDTLPHAVTLTFGALTLTVCDVSAVM